MKFQELIFRGYFLVLAAFHWAVSFFVFFYPDSISLVTTAKTSLSFVCAYSIVCFFLATVYFLVRKVKNLELGMSFVGISFALNAFSTTKLFGLFLHSEVVRWGHSAGIGGYSILIVFCVILYQQIKNH